MLVVVSCLLGVDCSLLSVVAVCCCLYAVCCVSLVVADCCCCCYVLSYAVCCLLFGVVSCLVKVGRPLASVVCCCPVFVGC